ncbi:MAG: hypothetical protein J3T61_00895, partial [Candidatus Brocadiales bacterium]|nr:hypothetical protein [Candidatus Bathyanammoxibius sp.]
MTNTGSATVKSKKYAVSTIEELAKQLGVPSIAQDPIVVAEHLITHLKVQGVAPTVFRELVNHFPQVVGASVKRIAQEAEIYSTHVNLESLKELMASLKFVADHEGTTEEQVRSQIVNVLLEIQSRIHFFEREYLQGKMKVQRALRDRPPVDKPVTFRIAVERTTKAGLHIPQTKRSRTVLLINPSQESVYGKFAVLPHPTLGLAYIGTVLSKAGHRVSILDADSVGLTRKMLMSILRDEAVEIVGIITVTPVYNRVVQ